VVVGVVLAGFFGVMSRVVMMPVRDVRVMSRLFMISGSVVFGSRAMMTRSVLVVLGGLAVMIDHFLGHSLPFLSRGFA
jgi:hypothetical protein